MESTKTALGILLGMGIGVVVGVLFAPDKGSNTRKKIMDKGKDYVDDLKYQFEGIKKEASEKFNNLKEETTASVNPR